MKDTEKELEEKRRKLQELINSRPLANCAEIHSSEIDVRREIEIEELEEDIKKLESRK